MDAVDWLIDIAVAIVSFFLGCAQLSLTSSTAMFHDETFRTMVGIVNVVPKPSVYIMLCLSTLPLAFRRRFPWPTLVFTMAIFLVAENGLPGYWLSIIGPMVAAFTVAKERPRLEIHIACVVILLAIWVSPILPQSDSLAMLYRIQNTGYMVVSIIMGIAFRAYKGYLTEAEERAVVAEKSREEEAARRVEEERVRIAREIHDITAHSLTAVSIQAAAAEKLVDRDPVAAKEAIIQVRATSKVALEEIRSMIGVLRNEGQSAETAPTTGTDRVSDLCAYAHEAGLQVQLDDARYRKSGIPAYIDVALFGIAREALTNVVRHAHAENVRICLESDAQSVRLVIEDDGSGDVGQGTNDGHGLQGMEERARVLHGIFSAGNRMQGGYVIRVEIPLTEREAHD